MSPLVALSFFCGLFLPLAVSELNGLDCVPRKSVLYNDNHVKFFQEEGIYNYSTMLVREDLGLLLLGAREVIYALDINNISNKKSGVYWKVTQEKQRDCTYKGKNAEVECLNYIRTLHKMSDGRIYVCGTNAFSPTCDYMTYKDGQLKLEGVQEEGKGKCPFDPFQRYSSLMVGEDLYSATSINFLGSEPVFQRSSVSSLRSEFKSSWLNEPNFISMALVPESQSSADGDDDKVYLFFSENAVEYDFYSKMMVSRVARVCKGDMGGQRTLQRKWTSFLKARLDCSVPEPSLPYVVQDVFLLRDTDWTKSVFYGVFTPQSGSSDLSAVCAYSVAAIREVFSDGKYKTPVTIETSHVKWVMYSGEVPVPRPGACINMAARDLDMQRSLDLPDKTLQFIRDRPLMDEAVRPLTGGPLLVKKGAMFTRVVVDRVQALDGQRYAVMFIGTENGFVQKAVNYDGEMFVIEEVQLFETHEPVKVLRLSTRTGLLYAGSDSGVVQLSLSDCGHYSSCLDCVLARDPYCAWDLTSCACSVLASASRRNMVQSVKEGDASRCPNTAPVEPVSQALVLGNNIKLPCLPDSNLAQVRWNFSGRTLDPSDAKYYVFGAGLLILNASAADGGRYTCEAVERVNGRRYPRTMAAYQVEVEEKSPGPTPPAPTSPGDAGPEPQSVVPPAKPQGQSDSAQVMAFQVALALLSLFTGALLLWNLYKGHLGLPGCPGAKGPRQSRLSPADFAPCPVTFQSNGATPETKRPGSTSGSNANNNNHSINVVAGNGERHSAQRAAMETLMYIGDESEI